MIYKFIDNNGSEITVNSLSSLQALVDSDTINEDTKVKAIVMAQVSAEKRKKVLDRLHQSYSLVSQATLTYLFF